MPRSPGPHLPGLLGKSSRSPWRLLLLLGLFLTLAAAALNTLLDDKRRPSALPPDFPAPVHDADVPPLGANVALHQYDDEELATALSTLADGEFVWIRQSFFWSQVRRSNSSGAYDWSSVDRLMEALRQVPRLRLVAVLDDDPPVPPEDATAFARFAGAFAERYGDEVDYYQIWDEPNLASRWGGGPVNAAAYADILARSAGRIRHADPDSRILLAGLAPTTEQGPWNLSEPRYLERLYEAGAAPFFDIVAAKPYGFDTGPEDRRVDESLLNVSRVILLREVMVRYGDGDKAIWASHWGWNALPDDWTGAPSIWGQTNAEAQASRSVALLQHASVEWPWMGAMIIENFQPEAPPAAAGAMPQNPRWGFALVGPDGTTRPVYDSISEWARSRPDAAPPGGHLAGNRWSRYERSWRVGPLGADPGLSPGSPSGNSISDQAFFRFDGTDVALTVRRGPYRAFLYVSVDGEPADRLPRDEEGKAYVVLYDTGWREATIPVASNLKAGVHTVAVFAEGGHGQWPLVDWRVKTQPRRTDRPLLFAGLGAASLVLGVLLAIEAVRIRWADLATAFLTWQSVTQVGLILTVVGILWLSSALSWGELARNELISEASRIISLLAVPVLVFLFALRLDVGLALVAFAAPFYLVPEAMFYRALSLPEGLALLTLLGYVVFRLAFCSRLARHSFCWQDARPERSMLGRASVIDIGIALTVISAFLAGAASRKPEAALLELRAVFLVPGIYYALLRLVPVGDAARRRIVDAFILGGIGVAAIGLIQVALGRNLVAAEGGLLRLQSVYPSPNNVGLYLGRVWPFLVVGAWTRGKPRRRRLFLIGLTLVTLALILSYSRGALLLALPASLLLIGWSAGGRYRWTSLALVAAGVFILIPLLRVPRFGALLDLGRGSTFLRLRLWQSSLGMIRDHPLLGVGPGNFQEAYRTRYILPSAWEEFNLEHAHNVILDHWTRLGLLGVASGLVLQLGFWRNVVRRPRVSVRLCLTGSMAAALAHGLVDNAFFFPDLALVFFLTLALAQRGWTALPEP